MLRIVRTLRGGGGGAVARGGGLRGSNSFVVFHKTETQQYISFLHESTVRRSTLL